MIDISTLNNTHVGRSVLYTDRLGKISEGVISSWNDKLIFVRYTSGDTAAGTRPEDLTWNTNCPALSLNRVIDLWRNADGK